MVIRVNRDLPGIIIDCSIRFALSNSSIACSPSISFFSFIIVRIQRTKSTHLFKPFKGTVSFSSQQVFQKELQVTIWREKLGTTSNDFEKQDNTGFHQVKEEASSFFRTGMSHIAHKTTGEESCYKDLLLQTYITWSNDTDRIHIYFAMYSTNFTYTLAKWPIKKQAGEERTRQTEGACSN